MRKLQVLVNVDSPFSGLDKSNASWQLTAQVHNWIQSDFRLPPKALQYCTLVNQVNPQFYVSRGRPDKKVTCDQMRKHNPRLFKIYTTELVNSFTPVLTYLQIIVSKFASYLKHLLVDKFANKKYLCSACAYRPTRSPYLFIWIS